MKYKTSIAIFLLFSIASKAYSNEVIQIVGEGKFDVENVFLSFEPARITVPSAIAHPYRLRITYKLIQGIVSELKKTFVPESANCGEWWCSTTPAHTHAELNFANPGMEIRWDLIDDRTSNIVGTIRDSIAIETWKDFETGAEVNLEENREFYFKILGYPPMRTPSNIYFPLIPSDPNHYVLSFQRDYASMNMRLEKKAIHLKKVGIDLYRLEAIELNQDLLHRTYSVQGPLLDVDYSHLGFYYSIGAPGSNYPSFDEQFISGP